jgi:uncharacterized protein
VKFQPDQLAGVNVISRIDGDRLWVNATEWQRSVLVPWVGDARAWAPSAIDTLERGHFEEILALAPEVVIFGSGPTLRFVSPGLYQALTARRIGIETMDTGAACRTYNVLAAEGRRVLAALLLPRAV